MEMERKDDGNTLILKRAADAQEPGESNAKRLKCCIEEGAFCCVVCTKPLRPPIFECVEGYFFCSSCSDKLPEGPEPEGKKCTLGSGCGGSLARSLGMEHAIQSILVDCNYADHGCTEKNTYYGNGRHSIICPYGRKCPEPGCDFTGRTAELLDHLTAHHKWPSTTFQYWVPFDLRVVGPSTHVLHCKDDGQLILVSVQPAEPPGLAVSLGWVEVVNPAVGMLVVCSVSFSCSPRHHSTSTVNLLPWWHFGWPPTEHVCVVPKVSDEPAAGPDSGDAGVVFRIVIAGSDDASEEDDQDDINYVGNDDEDDN